MAIAKPVVEPGLHLVVDLEAERLTVLRAARIGNASRRDVRSPVLEQETLDWSRFGGARDRSSPTASELCLALLDAGGKVVETFAWSARAQTFFDRSNPEDPSGMRGGPRETRETLRLMQVPVPDSATYLWFYRSDLYLEPRRLAQQPLATYFLTEHPPRPLPLPIPGPVPERLPWADRWKPRSLLRSHERTELFPWWAALLAAGYVEGVTRLVNHGDPAHRFNIVILGEGFRFDELSTFDDWAKELSDGLLAVPPFDALASLINVYTVRTVSYHSGVSHYPAPNTWRLTYYGVEGHFENPDYPEYFGTHVPQRVWDAAEFVAPLERIHLPIVLLNLKTDGASAPPHLGMAFAAHWLASERFINMTAHECCHVIAGASEEYIGCSAHDTLAEYPNQATEQERATGTAKWLGLATPGELKAGHFRAVHQIGDPFDVNGKDPVFIVEPARNGMLGLYWGCQDTEPAAPPATQCQNYLDFRGRFFYRPMAKCKMRRSMYDFCRVCDHEIRRKVLQAAV